MATIATELIEEKRDGRGRQMRSAQEREALVRAYEESGLTQKAFAAREGVNYTTLVAWLQAARRARPAKSAAFAEVSTGVRDNVSNNESGIEIALPDGVVVRGLDLEAVIMVATRLRRC